MKHLPDYLYENVTIAVDLYYHNWESIYCAGVIPVNQSSWHVFIMKETHAHYRYFITNKKCKKYFMK